MEYGELNVSIPFSVEVTMYAGSNHVIGADGLVFVLQDISNSLVGGGGDGLYRHHSKFWD